MTRKMNNIPFRDMVYKPEIIPCYKTKYQPGVWKKNKETKQMEFTGKVVTELVGHRVMMFGFVDGKKITIIQGCTDVHEKPLRHFKSTAYQPGTVFDPFTARFPLGEILPYELS